MEIWDSGSIGKECGVDAAREGVWEYDYFYYRAGSWGLNKDTDSWWFFIIKLLSINLTFIFYSVDQR